ncbi:Glucosyl transferase GtrII [Butyrivibrio sp. Su6]|uniref:glucosyltransferase domain-containing protein n=1 Tax=Butyrivibrio sp. Su6 TaxID=1520810 RepID=UPI00089E3FE9|nr:glucosyltransferase domain-containing protein [Butyrivibrio sp. Su6]SEG15333.1 Glucosyl transferase GtrII [Butyrivibrio sp. Su6]
MKIIVDKLKENKKVILYSFFLTLLFFGINYKIEYATDTYYNFMQKGAWKACLENGRPFLALCFYVLESLPISVAMIYHIMQILGIVFLTVTTVILTLAYKKYIEKEVLSVVLAFLTIANPLIIEYFLFEEKGIFMMAIFLNVVAALITENMWKVGTTNNYKRLAFSTILSVLCMLIAVFSYQTSVQVYVIVCLPFIVISSKNVIDFIKKNIYVAVLYGVSMASALGVAKYIIHTDRANVSMDLLEGFRRAAGILRTVTFDRFFNLSSGIFAFWCVLILAVIVIAVIRTKENKAIALLSFIYIILGCVFTSFVIFALNSSALSSPRTVYTYGMIFGIVLFYAVYLGKDIFVSCLSLVVAVIILIYEYLNFGSVFIDRYQCNAVDRYYAQIIREQIRQYEDETGNEIDTICFYIDADRMWWDEGYSDTELMTRAQACGWSALNSINLYLGRNYTEGEQDPEIAEYFSEQNWGMYSEDQLIFKGNELHLCVY